MIAGPVHVAAGADGPTARTGPAHKSGGARRFLGPGPREAPKEKAA